MSESKVPNPFECAKRIVGVSVTLKSADIVHASPNVSLTDVEQLLDRHASIIAVQMLNAGISASLEIIRHGIGQVKKEA